MQLTQEQEKKLKRIAKLVDFETKGAVVLIEDIFALEDEFGAKIPELKELVEKLRKERPDRDEIKEIVSEIVGKVIPEKGDKGDDGEDYILTEDDKKEIASLIEVPKPKPDKIIEKTETIIKEQPIEIIKEVAVISNEEITARGEAIRDGLELLQDDDRLDKKAIKGLDDYDEVARLAKQPRQGGGGKQNLYQQNDVNIQSPTNGQVLKYNTSNNLWENSSDSGLSNPVDYIQFNTGATPQPSAPGLIQWNSADGTYDMGLLNSSVLQVGQETMFYGKASGTIANGDLCQFAGVQGNHILIKKAVGSEIEANPHFLVGVATENIANNNFGYVTWFGKINGVYTKTPANQDNADWVAGDILYFNVTTGQMTKTMPSVPNRIITVAAVIKAQTGSSENGIIIVRPTWGLKMQDLDDVNGTALTTDGQIPTWHNTSKYFDFDKSIYKSTDFYESRNVTITRNANNRITQMAVSGGRTLTPTRNANGYIISITDGTKTWTINRTNNFITSITVV